MNILGIDFEEWYHPELVKPHIKNIKRNPSVINGIDKILDLLRKRETFATFFVVGELLEIQPDFMFTFSTFLGYSPFFKNKFADGLL